MPVRPSLPLRWGTMTSPSTDPAVRSLPAPLKAWERLGGAGKFTLYTRVSLQVVVVMFVLSYGMGIVLSLRRGPSPEGWPAALAATLVVFALLVGLAVLSFERQPELRNRETKPLRPVFLTGIVVTAVVSLIGAGIATLTPTPWGELGQSITLVGALILGITYIPFLERKWLVTAVLVVGLALVSTLWLEDITGIGAMWALLPLTGTVLTVLSVWSVGLIHEAERATELQRTLTLAEERLRFAQELHDTMGQHLAAMSVKAELALALARRGDGRLEGELEDLQRLTRASISDMREVVEGYRRINLATEIDGARALLATVDIPLTVTGDAFDVPEAERELAAWFVREAATNVLRHSSAMRVTLELTPESVTMANDGVREDGPLRLGGLDALRRRAATRAARLTVDRSDDEFSVTLDLNPIDSQREN